MRSLIGKLCYCLDNQNETENMYSDPNSDYHSIKVLYLGDQYQRKLKFLIK